MSLIIFSAIEETAPETLIPPAAVADPTVGELTPQGEFRLTLDAALAVESEESQKVELPSPNVSSKPALLTAIEEVAGLTEVASVPPDDPAEDPFGSADFEWVAAEIVPKAISTVEQEKSVTLLPSSKHKEETSDSALPQRSGQIDGVQADSAETRTQAVGRPLAGELLQVDTSPQLDLPSQLDPHQQVHTYSQVDAPSQVETLPQRLSRPQVETAVDVTTLVPVVDEAVSESITEPEESAPEYLRDLEDQEPVESSDRSVLEHVPSTAPGPRLVAQQVPEVESVPGEVTKSDSDELPAYPLRPATIETASLDDGSLKQIQRPAPAVAHSQEAASLHEGDVSPSNRAEPTVFPSPARKLEPGEKVTPAPENQVTPQSSPISDAETEWETEAARPRELSNDKVIQAAKIPPELQIVSLPHPAPDHLTHDAQQDNSNNETSIAPDTSIERQATTAPLFHAATRPTPSDRDSLRTVETTNRDLEEVEATQRNDEPIPRSGRPGIVEPKLAIELPQSSVELQQTSDSDIELPRLELPRSEVEFITENSSFISGSSASSTSGSEAVPAGPGPLELTPEGERQSFESAPVTVSQVDLQPTRSSTSETHPSINITESVAVRNEVGRNEVAVQSTEAPRTELKSEIRSTLPILLAMRPKPGNSSSPEIDRLQIRLDPPELGRVLVDVASTEEGLTARISAIDSAARVALAEELPFLKSALSEAGIENVDIDLSDDDSGFERHDADQQENETRGHITELQTATAAAGRNNSTASNANVTVLASGNVDILA